jgi:hypothetical protein
MFLACGHPLSALTAFSFTTGLVVAVVGSVAMTVMGFTREFGRSVPENFFGLCSGMPGEVVPTKKKQCCYGNTVASASKEAGNALAVWLTEYLNKTAGLAHQPEPLTFGQLWEPNTPVGHKPIGLDPNVRLEMMTTCLTWGRPFRLPFRNEEDARENRFYFRESEFRQLFPDSVVNWLCANPRQSKLPQKWRKIGYIPLPEPWNLPVVVATRMSLSFPILLSAIPLYSYEPDAKEPEREQNEPHCCWFSDGGICSNFPMHFFDSPLPRWPTFALNLVSKGQSATDEEMKSGWMPADNNEGIKETWNNFHEGHGIGRIFGFLGSIIVTMQNWSDNTLSRMPGYRDRISHVPLKPSEGGLNLDMPQRLIIELGRRGSETGKEFVRRFASGTEPKMNWDNHRWLRLRSLLASLESTLEGMETGCAYKPQSGFTYEDWLKQTNLDDAPCYKFQNQDQRKLALETIQQIRDLVQNKLQPAKTPLEKKAPRPRPELRPRPQI